MRSTVLFVAATGMACAPQPQEGASTPVGRPIVVLDLGTVAVPSVARRTLEPEVLPSGRVPASLIDVRGSDAFELVGDGEAVAVRFEPRAEGLYEADLLLLDAFGDGIRRRVRAQAVDPHVSVLPWRVSLGCGAGDEDELSLENLTDLPVAWSTLVDGAGFEVAPARGVLGGLEEVTAAVRWTGGDALGLGTLNVWVQETLVRRIGLVANDCEGLHDASELPDADDDGFSVETGDCDDDAEDVHPGAEEVVGNDVDDDCDGVIDEPVDRDHDGISPADGDCDDTSPWASPAEREVCDGIDNDCDGAVDEGCDAAGTR